MEAFIRILKEDGVIGIPTETVYGLAGNALSDKAVLKIYAMKNRPIVNPLIIHVASLQQALQYGVFDEDALKLAHYFWPPSPFSSSLTLVVPLKPNTGLSSYVTAGLNTIAIRVPNHSIALTLLKQCDFPLAAPSANPSTQLSPTQKTHIQFPNLMVLEGGNCEIGIESTIVKRHEILRPGIITQMMLEKVLNKPITILKEFTVIQAPGMMKKHYAPKTPVVINSISFDPSCEALLGFGSMCCTLNLSPSGDLKEAAKNLFAFLHQLDSQEYKRIHIAPLPLNEEIGLSLYDKLVRMS